MTIRTVTLSAYLSDTAGDYIYSNIATGANKYIPKTARPPLPIPPTCMTCGLSETLFFPCIVKSGIAKGLVTMISLVLTAQSLCGGLGTTDVSSVAYNCHRAITHDYAHGLYGKMGLFRSYRVLQPQSPSSGLRSPWVPSYCTVGLLCCGFLPCRRSPPVHHSRHNRISESSGFRSGNLPTSATLESFSIAPHALRIITEASGHGSDCCRCRMSVRPTEFNQALSKTIFGT